MEDFVFESHTSIISQELLFEKLSQKGIEPEPEILKEEDLLRSYSNKVEEVEKKLPDLKTVFKSYKGNI